MNIFHCFRFETPPTWRARWLYLHLPETGWPSYTPRHSVPFSSLPTTCRATMEVFKPASTWGTDSKSYLLYDWQFTAKQFVLASSPLRLTTRDFFQLNPCGHSPYVTSSLTKRWVCPLWICLAICQVYVLHIWHVIKNSFFCTIYKPPVSPGFRKQIMLILCILCYNGSLVSWMVISLTTANFKPLISSVWLRLVLYCEYVHSHRTDS
jgi:hypothetical protein